MTDFERLVLTRLNDLADEVRDLATVVARLDERERGQEKRLSTLEQPPPSSARRSWKSSKGLYLSNATIAAVVSALLALLSRGADDPTPPKQVTTESR